MIEVYVYVCCMLSDMSVLYILSDISDGLFFHIENKTCFFVRSGTIKYVLPGIAD